MKDVSLTCWRQGCTYLSNRWWPTGKSFPACWTSRRLRSAPGVHVKLSFRAQLFACIVQSDVDAIKPTTNSRKRNEESWDGASIIWPDSIIASLGRSFYHTGCNFGIPVRSLRELGMQQRTSAYSRLNPETMLPLRVVSAVNVSLGGLGQQFMPQSQLGMLLGISNLSSADTSSAGRIQPTGVSSTANECHSSGAGDNARSSQSIPGTGDF
jgi:hypothetical protein